MCIICGKEFTVLPSQIKDGNGVYCSRKCMGIGTSKKNVGEKNPNWKGGKVKCICKTCGKEFTVKQYTIKNCHGIFCSRECKGIYQSKYLVGENHPSWKGGGIQRICKICGIEFTALSCEVENGGGKYCSQKCAGIAKSMYLVGSSNPNWKGGKVTQVCPICGKTFMVKPSRIKRGFGKYCSRSCVTKVIRHKAKSQMTCPEQIFEHICTKHDLPFRFTGNGNKWIGNANPDFVHKTRKVVCEIFGDYWHSPLLNNNIKYTMTLDGRKAQLKKEGYKLIVFWETDLKREDAEAFVFLTLKKNKIKF